MNGGKHSAGLSLLELMIAMTLASIILLVIDRVVAGAFQVRATLAQAQQKHHAGLFMQHALQYEIQHAGFLGCRALSDGLTLDWTPIEISSGQLSINNTVDNVIELDMRVSQATQFIHLPSKLTEPFETFVIADCESAEVVSGTIKQQNTLMFTHPLNNAYGSPIYLMPVTHKSWYLNGDVLYFKQVSPPKLAQALLNDIATWAWEKSEKLLRLSWSNPNEHTHVWVLDNAL